MILKKIVIASLCVLTAACATRKASYNSAPSAVPAQPIEQPVRQQAPPVQKLYPVHTTAALIIEEPESETPSPSPSPSVAELPPVSSYDVPMTFTEIETMHVRFSRMAPYPGETLVVPLPPLQSEFCYPAPGKVISPYGVRGGRIHTGDDIKAWPRDTIRAAFPGVVRMSRNYSGYGNIVVIRHAFGLETAYGHNVENLVQPGDHVEAGQAIALAGRTGRATTEHCHFEVRAAGEPFRPSLLINHDTRSLRSDTLYIHNSGGKITVYNAAGERALRSGRSIDGEPTGEDEWYATPEPGASTPVYYTVKKGDGLAKIAKQYNTTVDAICKLNNITSKTTLSAGRKLIVGSAPAKATPPAKKTPAPATTAPAAPSAVAKPVSSTLTASQTATYHTVKQGDTLYAIALKYGTTVSVICKMNNLTDKSVLRIGQKVRVK